MSDTGGSASYLELAERAGRWFENTVLAALLAAMIVLATTQIVLRTAGAGSLVWADEAVRLSVLWIALVGGVAAAREDRHIAIDVLSRFLPGRLKAGSAAVIDAFTIAVCLALAWYGWIMIRYALEDGDKLLAGLPAWPFQAIIPAAFLCMAWRYFIWLIRHVRSVITGRPVS